MYLETFNQTVAAPRSSRPVLVEHIKDDRKNPRMYV